MWSAREQQLNEVHLVFCLLFGNCQVWFTSMTNQIEQYCQTHVCWTQSTNIVCGDWLSRYSFVHVCCNHIRIFVGMKIDTNVTLWCEHCEDWLSHDTARQGRPQDETMVWSCGLIRTQPAVFSLKSFHGHKQQFFLFLKIFTNASLLQFILSGVKKELERWTTMSLWNTLKAPLSITTRRHPPPSRSNKVLSSTSARQVQQNVRILEWRFRNWKVPQ